MSRSGFVEMDCFSPEERWDYIRCRGAVKSAIRGKRGQAFLRELVTSLDALPEPKLIAEELQDEGCVCAIGSVGLSRGIDLSQVHAHYPEDVAETFGIAQALVQEIEYENDGGLCRETPEERWTRMRAWASARIVGETPDKGSSSD